MYLVHITNAYSGCFEWVASLCSSVEEGEGSRAAKRSRTEEDEFPEEDRHFLLSLESHMRDVPRASKLALREDMLRLVRKYTDRTRPSEASTSDTHTNSQEYWERTYPTN